MRGCKVQLTLHRILWYTFQFARKDTMWLWMQLRGYQKHPAMLRLQAGILIGAFTCRADNIGAVRYCGCRTAARIGRHGIART